MKTLLRCFALAAALAPLVSAAQSYPTRAVRLMVPFPPGGATDIVGRLVSAKMQDVWGQPVLVENRPGAGTVVGTDYVAKSAPAASTWGWEAPPTSSTRTRAPTRPTTRLKIPPAGLRVPCHPQ